MVPILSSSPARAEDENAHVWDQAAVTQLAVELEQTLRDAYAKSAEAPPQTTVFQQRTRDAAVSVMRRARDLSTEYASKMRAGWDREASSVYFKAVADEYAFGWTTAQDAVTAPGVQPRIERLDQIIAELQAYYDYDAL
jgi:hypothetical protein